MRVYIVRGWRDSGEDCLAVMSTPKKAEHFIEMWLAGPGGSLANWGTTRGWHGEHDREDLDYFEMTVDDCSAAMKGPVTG